MVLATVLLSIAGLLGIYATYRSDPLLNPPEKAVTPKDELEQILNAAYGEGSVAALRVVISDGEMSFQGMIIKRRDNDSISNNAS